ncbi:PREDICTED: histone-lysine N-methyltransferase ASHR2 [Nicotiana attenuata]|uniref:Histone-lysine n-methyltransferase ashr2 n=1 Tax=Nicotiana attenuata TaxID=49451 RepID=A0A314KMB2_NICAT|nr:PREDICTED: histone-lysine N-methyltransferase ASHR2 [Nicotiana attenuata]OIT29874.1 histone-lysine n-methyltransferase ashr2 [Nicotiana attenuata]
MEKTSQSPHPLLKIAEIQGRGRGLISTQPLKPGQVVLKDSPLLLYSASPLIPSNNTFCSNCFKIIHQSPIPCPMCTFSAFCNSNCQSIALSSSHTPWVCQSLTHLRNILSSHNLLIDQQIQARFLISAYNLALISPSSFRVLLSLQGEPSFISENEALLLHSLVATLNPPTSEFGFSKELTAALLAKDKVNAFGLMEPFDSNKERGVRAYGIYPMASFFNHDCLPNACRFEYVDSEVSDRSGVDMIVRVIHDVPEGREICLSYFPVNFKYSDRQKRLKEDYGFVCNCDRCVVEVNWSDHEDDDAMDNEGEENEEEEDEAMEEDVDDEVNGNDEVEEGDQDFPHAYFFVRYMCNRENCGGTLAPLPPSDASPSTVIECNVCGNLSKCDELMV